MRIQQALNDGDDPSALGRAAHRIKDWAVVGGRTYVDTPRNPWHRATARELKLLKRAV